MTCTVCDLPTGHESPLRTRRPVACLAPEFGDRLEALAIEKITIPGLENLSNNLTNVMSDKSNSPGLNDALSKLQNSIKDQIKKDQKQADELNK